MSIGKFNIVLVGNSKVGKTSFLQRNLTRDFNLSTRRAKRNLLGEFIPTTFHLTFETEQGVVEFEVIECDDSNLPLEFDASAAILMFDVTNKESYNHLGYWRDTVFDHFGELSTIGLIKMYFSLLERMYASMHKISIVTTTPINTTCFIYLIFI